MRKIITIAIIIILILGVSLTYYFMVIKGIRLSVTQKKQDSFSNVNPDILQPPLFPDR